MKSDFNMLLPHEIVAWRNVSSYIASRYIKLRITFFLSSYATITRSFIKTLIYGNETGCSYVSIVCESTFSLYFLSRYADDYMYVCVLCTQVCIYKYSYILTLFKISLSRNFRSVVDNIRSPNAASNTYKCLYFTRYCSNTMVYNNSEYQ